MDFLAGDYLSEATSPPRFFFDTGEGDGGGSCTREKIRGAKVYNAGSKIQIWLTVYTVYKLW